MKKIIALVLVMMCLTASATALQLPMVGFEAPDFEVELINGEVFRLSEQRGKVVLLNIWATWCNPCVMEMPDIDRLAKDYADELVVIGVNSGDPLETVIEFVEENGYSYLFAADTDYYISGMLYPTYGGIPYTIVIDANGIITRLHNGSRIGMYEVLEGYVLEAIESGKPSYQILA